MKNPTISTKIIALVMLIIILLQPITASAYANTEMDCGNQIENPVTQVCAKHNYSFAVREDGSVLYAGDIKDWQEAISSWENIDCIVDGYFAKKKDGSYTSVFGPTNLPVLESPISISEGTMGNWVALLPDGSLLNSPDLEHVDQFSSDDFGYRMSGYHFKQVVFGADSYFGLLESGKVLPFCGSFGEEIANWSGVKNLCFCYAFFPIALTEDGRVLSSRYAENIDTSGWRDVIKLASNYSLTVGLRSDGTVLTTGGEWRSVEFLDDFSEWTDIIDVAVNDNTMAMFNDAGSTYDFAVGLKNDGTVVVAGDSSEQFIIELKKTISEWQDIKQISVGKCHVLGLKANGTVVAAGDNEFGQCSIDAGVYQISTGISNNDKFFVGITSGEQLSQRKVEDTKSDPIVEKVESGFLKTTDAVQGVSKSKTNSKIYAITLTAVSDSKTYDGTPLINDKVIASSLASKDHMLTADYEVYDEFGNFISGGPIDVGVYTKKVGNIKIMNGNENITDLYEITTIDGQLIITPPESK